MVHVSEKPDTPFIQNIRAVLQFRGLAAQCIAAFPEEKAAEGYWFRARAIGEPLSLRGRQARPCQPGGQESVSQDARTSQRNPWRSSGGPVGPRGEPQHPAGRKGERRLRLRTRRSR